MSNCKFCSTSLTALNLSDIEPDCCQSCEAKLISQLELIEEDQEISTLSNNDLDTISKTLFPTPIYLTNKIIKKNSQPRQYQSREHWLKERRVKG